MAEPNVSLEISMASHIAKRLAETIAWCSKQEKPADQANTTRTPAIQLVVLQANSHEVLTRLFSLTGGIQIGCRIHLRPTRARIGQLRKFLYMPMAPTWAAVAFFAPILTPIPATLPPPFRMDFSMKITFQAGIPGSITRKQAGTAVWCFAGYHQNCCNLPTSALQSYSCSAFGGLNRSTS